MIASIHLQDSFPLEMTYKGGSYWASCFKLLKCIGINSGPLQEFPYKQIGLYVFVLENIRNEIKII